VSAELTNQPTPAIFHRQSRCMAAGPARPAPLRNGDASERWRVLDRAAPQSLPLRYDSKQSIVRR